MQKNIQCPLRFLKWVSVDYQPSFLWRLVLILRIGASEFTSCFQGLAVVIRIQISTFKEFRLSSQTCLL